MKKSADFSKAYAMDPIASYKFEARSPSFELEVRFPVYLGNINNVHAC